MEFSLDLCAGKTLGAADVASWSMPKSGPIIPTPRKSFYCQNAVYRLNQAVQWENMSFIKVNPRYQTLNLKPYPLTLKP